jgi:hypothetical protein
MDDAVLAITDPERPGKFEDWNSGLFLHQRWMNK